MVDVIGVALDHKRGRAERMSENLPSWLNGRGSWSHKQRGWFAVDKLGTSLNVRTHPQGFREYLIEFKEGDRRGQEILFRSNDLRLMKEILNQMTDEDLL